MDLFVIILGTWMIGSFLEYERTYERMSATFPHKKYGEEIIDPRWLFTGDRRGGS